MKSCSGKTTKKYSSGRDPSRSLLDYEFDLCVRVHAIKYTFDGVALDVQRAIAAIPGRGRHYAGWVGL